MRGAHGSHKILKQLVRETIVRHAFRVPLNADDPGVVTGAVTLPFNGLDDAVRRLVDVLDAAIDEQVADHLAHVLVVVDDQNAQRLDGVLNLVLRSLG